MKKFLIKFFSSVCLFVLFFELFAGTSSPLFSLRQFFSDVKTVVNFNSKLNLKNDLNYNIDGKLIELRTNNIGFLSHSDFNADSLETKTVLIGDSFIESKVCGTDNSIAYYLEKGLKSEVFNFGQGGWNINNYYSVYEKYELEKAKIVFIMVTGINDISWKKNNNKIKPSKSKLIKHFRKRFFGNKKQSPDYSLLKNNFKNVVYVFHDNILEEVAKNNGVLNDIITINDLSSDFRFSDGHFNRKGNKLIADLLVNYIENKSN